MGENKGTSTTIEEIIKRAEAHYGEGEVIFVGLKYQKGSGWIAKIKRRNAPSLTGHSTTSSGKALRRLSKRLSKVIQRYNMV